MYMYLFVRVNASVSMEKEFRLAILLVNTGAMLTTGENTEIYFTDIDKVHKRLLIRRAFNDSITMATQLILTCTCMYM